MTTTHRAILYLEPSRHTPFLVSLHQFFALVNHQFGPSSASQYAPHCSMTGFFDIPVSLSFTTICSLLEVILSPPFPPPHISGLLIPPGKAGLFITLDAPEEYHELVKEFKDQMHEQSVSVRKKRIDHISLAYGSIPELGSEICLTKETVGQMKVIAEEMIKLENEEWDIVLYELLEESTDLNKMHVLKEIQRWKVTNK